MYRKSVCPIASLLLFLLAPQVWGPLQAQSFEEPPERSIEERSYRDLVAVVSPTGEVAMKLDFDSTGTQQSYTVEAGLTNGYPFAGRWDADSTESLGVYSRSQDRFFLRRAQTTGVPDISFKFFEGTPERGGRFPLMGDWDGDGLDTAGVFNNRNKVLYYKNSNDEVSPVTEFALSPGSGRAWMPVAGDWNGDGMDEVALFHPNQNRFVVYENLQSTNAVIHINLPAISPVGSLMPVAGDWDADGKDFVGVYDSGNQTFYLLHSQSQLASWDDVFSLTGASGRPVAGSWDGISFRLTAAPTVEGARLGAWAQLIAAPEGGFDLYLIGGNTSGAGDSVYHNKVLAVDPFHNNSWELPETQEVRQTDGAAALGMVFTDPEPTFHHPDGTAYRQLMVMTVEVAEPTPIAGWVCLSYSQGDDVWTEPIYATTDPLETPRPCENPGNTSPDIMTEQVAGFRLGGNLHIAVMNGDNPALFAEAPSEPTRTQTYLYLATVEEPWLMVNEGEFSEVGVFNPNTEERWVHNFGINLDVSFDLNEFAVYWTRAYPYPFDFFSTAIPCDNQGCPDGPQLNPNRVQVYRMQLDPAATYVENRAQLLTDTWEFLHDLGASHGYPSESAGLCGDTPLIDPIQDGFHGLDINSVAFVKNQDGTLYRDGEGKWTLIFGAASVKDRATGECNFGERGMYLWRQP